MQTARLSTGYFPFLKPSDMGCPTSLNYNCFSPAHKMAENWSLSFFLSFSLPLFTFRPYNVNLKMPWAKDFLNTLIIMERSEITPMTINRRTVEINCSSLWGADDEKPMRT
jgi:hypothetical protein